MRRAIQALQRSGGSIQAEYHVHLARALVGLGRTDEARTELVAAEELLAEAPQTPGRVELEKEIQGLRGRIGSDTD